MYTSYIYTHMIVNRYVCHTGKYTSYNHILYIVYDLSSEW